MATSAHDIAAATHHRYNVDFDFAAETVEEYIARMEEVDGRIIDRAAIAENDADLIIGTIISDQRRGEFGAPELDAVADAADTIDQAQDAIDQARSARDRAIRRAIARGARVVDVMTAARVTRARIDQIRKDGVA